MTTGAIAGRSALTPVWPLTSRWRFGWINPTTAPLDYYLLPRLDFGLPRIHLAEHNSIEFESYRFESLDYLYGMAERTRVRRAA
jgi:hypothetical protein